jgi:ABC-type nitrate/sulfonate/bicarbonate transport system substrate-binding protein
VRPVFVAVAVLSAVIAFSSCGDEEGGDGDGGRTLRVGSGLDFDIGDSADRIAFRRLEEQRGIKTSIKETAGGQNAVAGLARGDLDVAKLLVTEAIAAVSQGADLRAILATSTELEQVLAATGNIDTIPELEGKEVGVIPPLPLTEAVLDRVLRSEGLTKSDVKISQVSDVAQVSALERGRFVATTMDIGDYEQLRQSIELNKLADLADTVPLKKLIVLVVSREFARKNAALIEDMVAGLLDGYEFVYSPEGKKAWTDEAKRFLEEEGQEVEDVESFTENLYEFYHRLNYWPRPGEPADQAEYKETVDFLAQTGLVEKAPPFDRVWDVSFWKSAG